MISGGKRMTISARRMGRLLLLVGPILGFNAATAQGASASVACDADPARGGGFASHRQVDGHPLRPPALPDGWAVSVPSAQGLRPQPLERMLQAVEGGRLTKIDSIIVARHGRLVLEAYFNGFDRDDPHETRSAVKSILSVLVGIARDRGAIDTLDRRVLSLFPERTGSAEVPPTKARMTIRDLLTMQAGLDVGRDIAAGPWKSDRGGRTDDWVGHVLDLPMGREPGRRFSYNTATSVLLGGVLRQAGGRPVAAFARLNLFDPLCITDYRWSFSPSGQAMTGSQFMMRPRDLAKIGQLLLDRGMWNGRRIVSAAWVDESTRKHVATRPTNAPPDPARDGVGYGYHWWTLKAEDPRGLTARFFASGNGGQKIYVYPGLDLVVVFTGSHYGRSIGHFQPERILRQFIFPAIKDLDRT